jgi:hypothetical protein
MNEFYELSRVCSISPATVAGAALSVGSLGTAPAVFMDAA